MRLSEIYYWGLKYRHPIFLGGLLLFFIVHEFFEKIFLLSIPEQILYLILVITSVLIIQTLTKLRLLAYLYVVFLLILLFGWRYFDQLEGLAYLLLFIYFSLISFCLFKDLMQSKRITASVIIGAFAGYFLIGVIWFFMFGYSDSIYPDTTSVDMTQDTGIGDMIYFSFITLTTIGYGDFSPNSSLGQKLAILEGLVGQFYIACVMAILVGKYLSNPREE